MAFLRKRRLRGRDYYYLEHSFRLEGRITTREKYLGTSVPKDLDRVKRELLREVWKERWFPLFETIRKGHLGELARMPPSAREKASAAFVVRFTYDTSRIEGSTLTLRDTADLLERHLTPAGRPLADLKEAESHRDVLLEVIEEKKALTFQKVLYWHHRLLSGTKPDIAGKLRRHQVLISGSRFVPPPPVEAYPLLMAFFKWFARSKDRLHPVELAGLVHLRFVTVHPFTDGNGRMGRLLMNFVLNRAGYPMLNIPYERRGGYYRSLERSQTRESEEPFLGWFFRAYIRENRRLLGKRKGP